MTVLKLREGEHLVTKGQDIKSIHLLLQGELELKTEYTSVTMGAGSVFGLVALVSNTYLCDCVVSKDCALVEYSYESVSDLKSIFKEQPKYCYAFLFTALKQMKDIYTSYEESRKNMDVVVRFIAKHLEEYRSLCRENACESIVMERMEELGQFVFEDRINAVEMEYVEALFARSEELLKSFYQNEIELCIGELVRIAALEKQIYFAIEELDDCIQMAKEYLLCDKEDLLELWYDLSLKLAYKHAPYLLLELKVHELEEFITSTNLYTEAEIDKRFSYYWNVDFDQYVLINSEIKQQSGEIIEVLPIEEILSTDFATYLMEYASYATEDIKNAKKLLKLFGEVADRYDTSNEVQNIRKQLTLIFYDVYEKAFFRTAKEKKRNSILELFFQFGIFDSSYVTKERMQELYSCLTVLNQQMEEQKGNISDTGKIHVYSIYQWLMLIYNGDKEPSKNEFDLDYHADLLEQRKNKYITREQENLLRHDQEKKVQFEIHNLFQLTNRTTSGRISTFCPVTHEENFVRTIDQMFLTCEKIHKTIEKILKIDYSCFYREVFFMAPSFGIERTQIMKEILPDVILMPNVGGRAMMWQETAAVKRDTSARFIFPILFSGDFEQVMLETLGRYRWEICRKVMGIRWNDISDLSLTSEYNDYLQFYRKNRDLSITAKEKLKSDLVHAKKNFREVFVMDYVNWMKYESQGNLHLNKVSRKILCNYVPFSKDIRLKLVENASFKDYISRCGIIRKKKAEKEKFLFRKYVEAGGQITEELQAHLDFYTS